MMTLEEYNALDEQLGQTGEYDAVVNGVGNLIAEHQRMRTVINGMNHGIVRPGFCDWTGEIRRAKDCTADNCVWMECQGPRTV